MIQRKVIFKLLKTICLPVKIVDFIYLYATPVLFVTVLRVNNIENLRSEFYV